MALVVSLTPFTIALTTSIATVVDATTGYGTRSNFGVFTLARKLDFTGAATSITTTGNNANPASDTQWTFSYSNSDGWYQIYFVAAPAYAGGTTYNQYDAVYDPATKSLYTSINGGNIGHTPSSSPTFWLLSSVNTIINNIGGAQASANLNGTLGVTAIVNTILYAQTTFNYGNLCVSASLEPCSDCKRRWDVTQLQYLRIILDGLQIASQRLDYSNGEKACRRAIALASLPAF